MEGLFLFFFLLKGEREGRERNREEKGDLYNLIFPPVLPSSCSSGLEPLIGGEDKFLLKNSSSFFVSFQSSCAIILYFWRISRGQKGEREKKKQGANIAEGEDKNEGTPETAVGEVS